MKYFLVFLFFITFCVKTKAQTEAISIHKAIASHLVEVAAAGNGGFNGLCVKLQLQNKQNRPLTLRLEAGTLFVAEDEHLQNLLVVEEQIIVMKTAEKRSVDVRTMCTESSDGSPYSGAIFKTTLLNAEKPLFRLAQKLSEVQFYASTAQSMVWAVANKSTSEHIYGEDTAKIKAIVPVLANIMGIPEKMFDVNPKPHKLTYISSSIEYLSSQKLPIKICVYDEANRLQQTSLEGYEMKEGYYQFKFGFPHYSNPERTFTVKLMSGDKVLAERVIDKNSSYLPLRKMNRAISATYDLPSDIVAQVGVYDSLDRLYAPLAMNYKLGKGFHESEFEGCRDLPMHQAFYFKIKNLADNQFVISQKIPQTNADAKTYAKIVKRGTMVVNLKEPLAHTRLVVVDTQDQIVWVVYEDSKISHGRNDIPFVFQHTQGPDAQFKVRLLDHNGQVIQEMCAGKCK